MRLMGSMAIIVRWGGSLARMGTPPIKLYLNHANSSFLYMILKINAYFIYFFHVYIYIYIYIYMVFYIFFKYIFQQKKIVSMLFILNQKKLSGT